MCGKSVKNKKCSEDLNSLLGVQVWQFENGLEHKN